MPGIPFLRNNPGKASGSSSFDLVSAIDGATAAASPADTSKFVLVTALGALTRTTWAEVKAALKSYFDTLYVAVGGTVGATAWNLVESTKYTATPDSTSTITMSDASDFKVGMGISYTYNSVTYFGVVTAISGDGPYTLTIAGEPLAVGGGANDITALYWGLIPPVVLTFMIPGLYGDGVADLLAADLRTYFTWPIKRAHVVTFKAVHYGIDSGANQPKVNIKVAGSAVSPTDTNKGVQLGNAAEWKENSAVAINTANSVVDRGDAIEVACTAAGTTGNATDLTVEVTLVLE